ncbi:MAG: delta-60 repeat domain-containing protein [Opitutae bacterium]|nr:delta-60 repeat domain-containing protein [Opitutae bacterium]
MSLLAQANSPSAADGFDPNVNGPVNAMAVQSDGKILLGGYFTLLKPNGATAGTWRNNLARVNADGTVDSFDPNVNGAINALAVRPDGTILIAGNFTKVGGVDRNRIARLKADGSLDTAFNPNVNGVIRALVVDVDGRILIGGDFTAIGTTTRNRLARLDANGALDATFNPNPDRPVFAIAMQPDKRILVGGSFTKFQANGASTTTDRGYFARLEASGKLDDGFTAKTDNSVAAIAVQPDGKILIGGNFSNVQPTNFDTTIGRSKLARFLSDGAIDPDFGNPNANGTVATLLIQGDGKILVGGSFTAIEPNGQRAANSHSYLARLNFDGSIDDAFSPGFNYVVNALVTQPDGKLLVGGNFTQSKAAGATFGVSRRAVARLTVEGALDTNLDPNINSRVSALAVQADGRVLIGGLSFASIGGQVRNGLARVSADGVLDATFNPNINGRVLAIKQLSNGKILVGGSFSRVGTETRNNLAQLNADGTVDTSFDPNFNGQVTAFAVQKDNKIVVVGSFSSLQPKSDTTATSRSAIARLNADGTLDTGYNPTAYGTVDAIALQSDDKAVIGGNFTSLNPGLNGTVSRSNIARLNTDGTVDSTFSPIVTSAVSAVCVQQDGKIIAGGAFSAVLPPDATSTTTATTRNCIARFNADGTIDTAFDPNANGQVWTLVAQSNGTILVGGAFTTLQPNGASNWTQRNGIARLKADGTLDTTFDPNANGQVRAIALQTVAGQAAKILFGGSFSLIQPSGGATVMTPLYMARVTDSDGKTDASWMLSVGDTSGSQVKALAQQSDGRTLIGGAFGNLAGSTTGNLIRLNADASLDTSFAPAPDGAVNAVAVRAVERSLATQARSFGWLLSTGVLKNGVNTAASVRVLGSISAIAVQAYDGKVLLGGTFTFTTPNGSVSGNNLLRLNADGTLDTGFNPNPNGNVGVILVQTDKRIVIGGGFTSLKPTGATDATTRNRIARLTAAGAIDTGFDPNPSGVVNAIVQQTDEKLIIGGAFTSLTPNSTSTATTRNYIARLNKDDGTVDAAFDPNADGAVYVLAIQAHNQKILVGGAFTSFTPAGATETSARSYLARLETNGSVDSSFDPRCGGPVLALAVQGDRKIIIGGNFSTVGGWPRVGLARVSESGQLAGDGFDPKADSQVNSIALQPDGSILVAGTFTSFQPGAEDKRTTRNHLARIKTDGSLDLDFDPDVDGIVSAVALWTDGSVLLGGNFATVRTSGTILVGGSFANAGSVARANLALLKDDGVADSSFRPNPNGAVNALALQSDGKFVVAGAFTQITGVNRSYIARFNAAGTLDTAYTPGPLGTITALALQADGKLIVGGPFTSGVSDYASLARLNTDGAIDTTFKPGPMGAAINALAVQADGKVLVAAGSSLVRLNTDGSRDSSFAPAPNGAVNTLLVQADGKILIGGDFTQITGVARNRAARLNADGTLDAAFDPNANKAVNTLALQSDGKLLLGGAFTQVGAQGRSLFARLAASTAANQTLALSGDRTTVTWTRGGASPEIAWALVEQSTDGIQWQTLGAASRVGTTSTWRYSGAKLTASFFYLRARALTPGTQGASSGISELQLAVTTGNAGASTAGLFDDFDPTKTPGGGNNPDTSTGDPLNPNGSGGSNGGNGAGGQADGVGRLVNLSSRVQLNGGGTLFSGFAIGGTTAKTVVVRAVGPTLTSFGVTGVLTAPKLQVFDVTGRMLVEKTGWSDADNLSTTFARVGAFPLVAGSTDTAAVLNLTPGAYSMHVTGGTGSGVVLAEVYDADSGSTTSRLTNLSSRTQVVDGQPFIDGLVVGGSAPRRLLIRGVGPALAAYNVAGVLADPVLSFHAVDGTQIAQNNDWQSPATGGASATEVAAAAKSVGAFDLATGSKDAALIVTVAPGVYTVQLSGANRTSGAAMVEVYDITP